MILVTGATGTVGSEVIRQLAEAGVENRALVHTPAKASEIAARNVEIAYGDLDDPASLHNAMNGVDKVFLLSQSGPRQVGQETNVAEVAVKAGVKFIVKLSVLGASPFTPIVLGRWHWECEKAIERIGIPFTALRPTFFMKNVLEYAQSIVTEGKFYAPMKDGAINFISDRDIAAVAVKALTQPGHENRVYDITGPEELTMKEVAEIIASVIGKPVEYVDVPPESVREMAEGMGMPDWLVSDMLWYYHYFSHRSGSLVTPVVSRVTGKEPMALFEWIKDHSEAFKIASRPDTPVGLAPSTDT